MALMKGRLKPGFGRLATLGEVAGILDAHLPRLGPETVPVVGALHRVLAGDVVAGIDVPHFPKSSMDGYAVVAEDTFGAGDDSPRVLDVVGSVSPGELWEGRLEPGRCVEIGTGAPLPGGADAVVMVEHTEPAGGSGRVAIRRGVAPGDNVIAVGTDVRAGHVVLRAGTLLEPRHLGVLAAVGAREIGVVRRPRVALFSTGPELVEPEGRIGPGRIFDINTRTLAAALAADGCAVLELGIVPDQEGPLGAAIARGLAECDTVLLSGGSSLGAGDLVGDVFARAGRMLVHGIAVKPGKPVVLGVARPPGGEAERVMIGLPGNPMSALSDYYIFVQPWLRRAMGLRSGLRFVEAVLGRKHASTVGRYEFLPVRLEDGRAVPITRGSSSISAMAEADGFVEIDENTEVLGEGERVRVRLF